MKNINILTFDVEDWFHLLGVNSTKSPKEWSNFEYRIDQNMNYIFDLLESKDLKASFFVLGWIARKFPHIVQKIDKLGHEIGTHSDLHQLIHQQTRTEFKEDLSKSIKSIEDLIGDDLSNQQRINKFGLPPIDNYFNLTTEEFLQFYTTTKFSRLCANKF